MTSVAIVHDVAEWQTEGDNLCVGFGASLIGRRFDYIDYEVPVTDEENAYVAYLRTKLVPGGIMNEIDPPNA